MTERPENDADGATMSPCCIPQRQVSSQHRRGLADAVLSRRRTPASGTFVSLPGGTFLMGTEDPEGYPEDAEGPIRPVTVAPFSISPYAVTNAKFTAFTEATGYQTDAELEGWSFVFRLLLHPDAQGHVMDAWLPAAPWWLAVHGATWRAPEGPGSTITNRGAHPVVHVSARDAAAYAAWAGVRLPTEAEWEFAARGGLSQAKYPWGDELMPDGTHRCNIWQGHFPAVNTGEDGWLGTAPVDEFPPNGFGLYNVAGNVWEICADTWPGVGADTTAGRVIRGGSYLCHESYCNRYRVAARTRTTTNSSAGNTGFRVAL